MRLLCETLTPSRRAVLQSSSALFAWAHLPKLASAAGGRDARFVTIILRGALDGLAAVAPVGDPDYAALHGELALSTGGPHPALPLDGFFALHPAMPTFARLFKKGEAAVVHAAATGYRERSHFDGQDVLESGLPGPAPVTSGWMNRALAVLPQGERVAASQGLAVGPSTPLILRGGAPVLGWAPQVLPVAGEELSSRLLDLYRHRDPALETVLREGLDTSKFADGRMSKSAGGKSAGGKPAGGKSAGGLDTPPGMQQAAQGAAKLMSGAAGPRIAALAFDGWDTHANEGGATGRLAALLGGLDGALGAFEAGLGDAWKDTTIAVVTEFGRTARINGTVGTDHGTGTVMFLAGGAVKGGRVIADWPGLKTAQLYQQRDLRPTTDVRAVLKGLLADQLGISDRLLASQVFPETGSITKLKGLVV